MISQTLQHLLHQSGIHIDKKMPKEMLIQKQEQILNAYHRAGYQDIDRMVILFMCYFDQTTITYKGKTASFDVTHMTTYFPHHLIKHRESLLEKSLVPLGIIDSGWYDVFADEQGAVYAIHIEIDEWIYYGENPFVALENILQNKPVERKNFL